jgi:hypothetical protein
MADNIFIQPVEQESRPKTAKRKTKKEMSAEEYERVCQRMTEMRESKKANLEKPKVAKPVKEKEVIKYIDRPVEVVKEVIKYVDKEVIKEVPAKAQKTQAVDLFGDTDDLKAELKEMKALLADMARAKREKAEAKQARESSKPEAVKRQPEPEKHTEPAVKQPEPEKAKPQRVIYTGPMGMFKYI